jgi:hypothetical protein
MENLDDTFVTVFYCHSIYEGIYIEGIHDNLTINIAGHPAYCHKKGVIVLPGNDEDAYYDKTSNTIEPFYWFAGSGEYPDPLDFTYYNASGPSVMPEKLIQLLGKRNTLCR